jgi:large subunit ribosomal protein L46
MYSLGESNENIVVSSSWRIVSSVCVQRFPTISRAKTQLEQQFHDLQVDFRMKKSRLSEFELEEKKYLEAKRDREKKAMEENIDVSRLDGGTEFEELQEARDNELKLFQPQPRITEADIYDDRRSLNRKLDKILYLIVKKRNENVWEMPQEILKEGQTLAQGAQCSLTNVCGGDLSVQFVSNGPVAYYKYRYPSRDDGFIGCKMFFMKAQYMSGHVTINNNIIDDHLWITKDELIHYLSNDYYKAISPALLI